MYTVLDVHAHIMGQGVQDAPRETFAMWFLPVGQSPTQLESDRRVLYLDVTPEIALRSRR